MQWTAREIGAASSIDLAGYGEGEWRWTHQAELRDAYGYLDRWAVAVADRRTRRGDTIAELAAREGLLALPATAFPAQLEVQRVVGRSALVAFEGNHYSVALTADCGVDNPPSRGAVCEQRKHGSVGAGAGNRPGYLTASYRARGASGVPSMVAGS